MEEKQHQETKTCYVCGSKEHLIKSCKKNTNLFVTNEEWPDISEEELKFYLEEYGKVNIIKTRRNSYLGEESSSSLLLLQASRGSKDSFSRYKYVPRMDSRVLQKQDKQNRVN